MPLQTIVNAAELKKDKVLLHNQNFQREKETHSYYGDFCLVQYTTRRHENDLISRSHDTIVLLRAGTSTILVQKNIL